MSVATTDSFTHAASRTFSSRCASRLRSWIVTVRYRVRSRRRRIGSGGTSEARSSPHSVS